MPTANIDAIVFSDPLTFALTLLWEQEFPVCVYTFFCVCVWIGQPEKRATGSTMGNVVHRMNVALGERGDRLTRAEDKTVELMHRAQQFADTAHKVT